MIRTFLRPNLIKRFNNTYIRLKCDLNCKERCVNLTSQQLESLNKVAKHTEIISIITIINLMGPIIIFGSTIVSSLISDLMYR